MSSVLTDRELLNLAMEPGAVLRFKRDTHFMILFVFACVLGCLHFEQGHQEGERGFRALVFVYAIWMKSVFASASCCIVKRHCADRYCRGTN